MTSIFFNTDGDFGLERFQHRLVQGQAEDVVQRSLLEVDVEKLVLNPALRRIVIPLAGARSASSWGATQDAIARRSAHRIMA